MGRGHRGGKGSEEDGDGEVENIDSSPLFPSHLSVPLSQQVRLRKMEMEKRDAERVKRMALEAKARAEANLEKRKKADQR